MFRPCHESMIIYTRHDLNQNEEEMFSQRGRFLDGNAQDETGFHGFPGDCFSRQGC